MATWVKAQEINSLSSSCQDMGCVVCIVELIQCLQANPPKAWAFVNIQFASTPLPDPFTHLLKGPRLLGSHLQQMAYQISIDSEWEAPQVCIFALLSRPSGRANRSGARRRRLRVRPMREYILGNRYWFPTPTRVCLDQMLPFRLRHGSCGPLSLKRTLVEGSSCLSIRRPRSLCWKARRPRLGRKVFSVSSFRARHFAHVAPSAPHPGSGRPFLMQFLTAFLCNIYLRPTISSNSEVILSDCA